jgi:trigger factor
VTLKVEAGPEDMEGILEQTYRELSRNIRVPGFRKGKVPRQIIEAQVGVEAVRAEAINKGLPTLYVMAVRESGIVPVSDPEINVLETTEEGGVVFEAKVDVKPEVTVEDYKGIRVEKPEIDVTEDDMRMALDEARERFATLEVVEVRPVEEGDFVIFDYKAFADGVPVEGKSGSDMTTQVGTSDFLPGFDEQLVGKRKGDILDVSITFPPEYEVRDLAGKPATYRTIIKEVKHKVLPPMDDALVKEISGFESIDEFKKDLRERIARIKEMNGRQQLRDEVLKNLSDRTFIDLPESMVDHEVQNEVEGFAGELAQRSIGLEEYLNAMKSTRYQLEKAVRERVEKNLKDQLLVDAVATAEDIEISDEDAEKWLAETAAQSGMDVKKFVAEAKKHDRIPVVKANLRLERALDVMADTAVIVGYAKPEPVEGEEEPAEGVVLETGEPEDESAEAVEAEPETVEEPAAEKLEVPGEESAEGVEGEGPKLIIPGE